MNRFIKFLKQDVVLICLFTLIYVGAISQDKNTKSSEALKTLSEYTENFYGSNDILVNGKSYIPDHFNATGNPYFFSDKLTKSILIIDGKKYKEQEILYNIEIEKLILKTTLNNSEEVLLVLNPDFIDAFYLGEHHFVNGVKFFSESNFPGFVEQVYEGNFSVVIRHQKSFVSQYTANNPNGFYSGTKSVNYIFNNGQLIKLLTQKSLLEYFSAHKKEIKKFMRKNKIKYKQANTIQLNKLFTYCDDISSK